MTLGDTTLPADATTFLETAKKMSTFRFYSEETGAVTVDWVVLTAALVGLGLATMAVVSTGAQNLSVDIEGQLRADNIIKSGFQPSYNVSFAGDDYKKYFSGPEAANLNAWNDGVFGANAVRNDPDALQANYDSLLTQLQTDLNRSDLEAAQLTLSELAGAYVEATQDIGYTPSGASFEEAYISYLEAGGPARHEG